MARNLKLGDRVTTHCYFGFHFGGTHTQDFHSVGTINYVGKDGWVGITWDLRPGHVIGAVPFRNQLPKKNLEKIGEPCTSKRCLNYPGNQNNPVEGES